MLSYFSKVLNGLLNFSWRLSDYLDIKTKIERFMTILGAKSYRSDLKKNKFPKWNKIKIKNLEFSFKNKKVLKEVSFNINKGKKIGIIGETGCGKSTLSKLLLNLYEVDKGEILIDDLNLNKIKESEINKKMSIVLQESEVFNSSIKKNITFEIKNTLLLNRVIQISQLKTLIKRLPEGLDTQIGEKGYKLSGGERQRIGIARALFQNPEILILDEATSSLDVKTEMKIVKELNKLNMTQIIIAHRLSTIGNADKIIVMDKGKIIERGTHKELLKLKGKYSVLWKMQQGK